MPRAIDLAPLQRRRAGVDQLVPFTLALRNRASRTLDIGACACVTPIQEEHARPDVDGEIVSAGEVMIESREQQFFDAAVAIALRKIAVGPESVWTLKLVAHRKVALMTQLYVDPMTGDYRRTTVL